MIEIPRAAYMIEKIAKEVDFISFGTNDLTQMFLGFSRDDSGLFIDMYSKIKILPKNPFDSLDIEGVGELIKITAEKARTVNPEIKICVCGEQAGDPDSIKFLLTTKVDSISVSPSRIPLAIIALGKYSLE